MRGPVVHKAPPHPAARAWKSLSGEGGDWSAVALKQRPTSVVLRLQSADGRRVIAKLKSSASAEREACVLRLAMEYGAPRLHGLMRADERRTWLFVEDAGSVPYRPSIPEHRAAASRWLAGLHGRAQGDARLARLHDRGPDWHMGELLTCRQVLTTASPTDPSDREVLENVLAAIDVIREHWSAVERVCGEFPDTLVHSDVKPANAAMRHEAAGGPFQLFDWGMAGRGPAVVDLHAVDLRAYAHAAGRAQMGDLQRAAAVSHLLRAVLSLNWASVVLEDDSDFPRERFQLAVRDVHRAARAVGWP